MRLQQDRPGQIKSWIHAVQGILLFLLWTLTIATFTRPGHSDGRLGWFFALCWLTIPILIYLVMVPMWSRARKFANVYAYACLDSVSVVFWLSAWACVASYVVAGKGKGEIKNATGCDNFKFGSPGRCRLSEAITLFGVIMMLAFIATAFISLRSVMHYKRTGMMPVVTKANDFSVQTQDAFSSNMHTNDFDEDRDLDTRNGRFGYQKQSLDDEYAPIHQTDHEDIGQMHPTQPGGPLNQGGLRIHDYDTSYTGAHGENDYRQQDRYDR